ncbi:hypothetical protein AAFF_G00173990 [Aldrovandia affinis]|uniref:Uncharacterized protein n=1 Tax=Aldrovandia affinis TaxID=143900 RepID=A0AAD7SZR7_9TELE|nr:hypothetical protein AAFF_G00173990 [Aldrovandia affinis]
MHMSVRLACSDPCLRRVPLERSLRRPWRVSMLAWRCPADGATALLRFHSQQARTSAPWHLHHVYLLWTRELTRLPTAYPKRNLSLLMAQTWASDTDDPGKGGIDRDGRSLRCGH